MDLKANWTSCGAMMCYTKECRAHCNLHFASDQRESKESKSMWSKRHELYNDDKQTGKTELPPQLDHEVMDIGRCYKLAMWLVMWLKQDWWHTTENFGCCVVHAQHHELLFLFSQPQCVSWDGQETEMEHNWEDSCVRVARLYVMWCHGQS